MARSGVLVDTREGEGEVAGEERDCSRWELRPLARAITAYWWAARERLELDRKGLAGRSWWGENRESWLVGGEVRDEVRGEVRGEVREEGRGWEGPWYRGEAGMEVREVREGLVVACRGDPARQEVVEELVRLEEERPPRWTGDTAPPDLCRALSFFRHLARLFWNQTWTRASLRPSFSLSSSLMKASG